MSLPERVKTKMKDAGLRAVNKPQRLNDSSSKSHIKKGKMSAAYWADKVKWSSSKTASPSKKWKKGS